MNPVDYGMTWQEVAEKRLEYIRRLETDLDSERNAGGGSVSNERLWAQIDRCDRLSREWVTNTLGLSVKRSPSDEIEYVKYPDPGCGIDADTGRFDMDNWETARASIGSWQKVVFREITRLRKKEEDVDVLIRHRNSLAAETTQLNQYIMQLHGLLEDEGVVLTDEFHAKADKIFNGGGEQK